MTVIGSGKASASTRSAEPRGTIASRSCAVTSVMRGRSASMRRGVNSRTTRRRSRVWCGASSSSMLALSAASDSVHRPLVRQSLPNRWSARAARASS